MSSSSVCQGLQSCLEPRVMERRVLRLKLAPQQGSNFSQPSPFPSPTSSTNNFSSFPDSEEDKSDIKSSAASSWSFLQTLSHNKIEDQVYVHPTVKRSSSVLSEKSLEMCTESLGSETGSNAGESSDDVSLFSSDTTTTCSTPHTTTTTTTTLASCGESKRTSRACNFPPPLTSITDLGGVHVIPRREGGRLIIEAVAASSPRPYFHAERGDGRLRLCLFESFSSSDDEGEEEECESVKKEEGAEAEEEECVENVEDEMGVKKFARPSRCKESGNTGIEIFSVMPLSFPRFLSVSE